MFSVNGHILTLYNLATEKHILWLKTATQMTGGYGPWITPLFPKCPHLFLWWVVYQLPFLLPFSPRLTNSSHQSASRKSSHILYLLSLHTNLLQHLRVILAEGDDLKQCPWRATPLLVFCHNHFVIMMHPLIRYWIIITLPPLGVRGWWRGCFRETFYMLYLGRLFLDCALGFALSEALQFPWFLKPIKSLCTVCVPPRF